MKTIELLTTTAVLCLGLLACEGAPADADPTADVGPLVSADAAPATEAPPEAPPEAPTGPGEAALVITELRFSDVLEPGVAPGFNIDGLTSDGRAENGGCFHPDQRGPDGTEGIDNQLATLMPIFRATEAAAIDGLLQESVNGGMVLYMVQMSDLDAWDADPAVQVLVQAASGPTPYLSTLGHIESDQTFALDPEAPANTTTAVLADGTLTAGPFPLALPVRILNAEFQLAIPIGWVQLTLNPDGSADGLFGGAVPVESIIELANGVDTSVRALATTLLRQKADLLPGEDGRCTAISAWWVFHAERAFVADW